MVGGAAGRAVRAAPGPSCSGWPTPPACCPTRSWPRAGCGAFLADRRVRAVTRRIARLSLNQGTPALDAAPRRWTAASTPGIPAIGLWREQVAELGAGRAARLVTRRRAARDRRCAGAASSPPPSRRARGGWPTTGARSTRRPLVGAPDWCWSSAACRPGSRDLAGARERVADALAELAPYARAPGYGWRWSRCTRCTAPTARVRVHAGPGPRPGRAFRPAGRRRASTPSTSGGTRTLARRSPGPATGSRASRCATGSCRSPADVLLGRGHDGRRLHRLRRVAGRSTRPATPGGSRSRSSADVWDAPGRDTVARVASTFDAMMRSTHS